MMEKWKLQITPLIESMEQLDDIRIRIKTVENAILTLTKRSEEDRRKDEDEEITTVRLLEEVQLLIEDVELKTNQLDMKLSAIERLLNDEVQ